MDKDALIANIRKERITWAGSFLYKVVRLRRQVVEDNITKAFPFLDSSDKEYLAKAFYSHLFSIFWENVAVSWMSEKRIKDKVTVHGMDLLLKAAEENKGILLLTGHFGNWELGPMAGIQHFPQFKGRLHILRRQIVNKTVEKILFRRFYQMGLDVIPKSRSLARVMDALSRNDTVAFIMDQYAKPGKEGVVTDFFGHPAGTFRSLALVARSAECPILPVSSWKEPGKKGKHVMKFHPPIAWQEFSDPDEEILCNTRRFNEVIEGIIAEHPAQWLWMHKRWKVKKAHSRKKPQSKV